MSDVERAAAAPESPGHWHDTVQKDGSITSTFIAYRPKEPPRFDAVSHIAELKDILRDVRAELSAAGPVAFNSLIMLIDGYTNEGKLTTEDDLDGAARAVLAGAQHVEGGALTELRDLLGV